MAGSDVAALVPHHARQLGFRHQGAEDAARHVDGAAGERECVDRGVLDHVELPGQVRTVGLLRQRLAEACHVRFELRVLVQPDALLDLLGSLLAQPDLLRFGDQVQLQVAGGGIADAGD